MLPPLLKLDIKVGTSGRLLDTTNANYGPALNTGLDSLPLFSLLVSLSGWKGPEVFLRLRCRQEKIISRNTIEKVDHSLCFTSSSDWHERNLTPYQLWYVSGTGRVSAPKILVCLRILVGGRTCVNPFMSKKCFSNQSYGQKGRNIHHAALSAIHISLPEGKKKPTPVLTRFIS